MFPVFIESQGADTFKIDFESDPTGVQHTHRLKFAAIIEDSTQFSHRASVPLSLGLNRDELKFCQKGNYV